MKKHLLFLFLCSFLACNAPEKPKKIEFVQNDMPKQHVQPEITAEMVVNRNYFVQTKSKKYEARVKITRFEPYEDPENKISGFVSILGQKNKKRLQKLPLKLHYLTPDTTQNLKQYDLTESEIIAFEDYNFDGNEDIAILDGETGPYVVPTYDIYLYDTVSMTFQKSKPFSKIFQDIRYWWVDIEHKKIITVILGGYTNQDQYIYSIKHNLPIWVQKNEIQGMANDSIQITKKTKKNGNGVQKSLFNQVEVLIYFPSGRLSNKKPFQNAAFETVFSHFKNKNPYLCPIKKIHISYFIFKKWPVQNKHPTTYFLK